MTLKVLDLFSGIGGFSLGFERAGMETVAFCEYEEHAQKILRKHWPDVPIYKDVRTLDGKQFRGSVDVVCGGFPCQPHSTAGRRNASSDDRDMWQDTARLVREVQPQYCVFENVRGLLTSESGWYFAEVLFDLSEAGYVVEWFVIPAAAVGAPHLRERVWIIAYSDEAQLKRGRISGRIQEEYSNAGYTRWGKDKPGVERTSNGIPFQMDRLGRLGNAVVPQIPELIGKAIIKHATGQSS